MSGTKQSNRKQKLETKGGCVQATRDCVVNLPRDAELGGATRPAARRGRKPESDFRTQGRKETTVGTQYTSTDLRHQPSASPSMTTGLRWLEAVNPAAAQNNAGDGLLMQAYTLSLASFCR